MQSSSGPVPGTMSQWRATRASPSHDQASLLPSVHSLANTRSVCSEAFSGEFNVTRQTTLRSFVAFYFTFSLWLERIKCLIYSFLECFLLFFGLICFVLDVFVLLTLLLKVVCCFYYSLFVFYCLFGMKYLQMLQRLTQNFTFVTN